MKDNSRTMNSRHSLKDMSYSMELSRLKEQFEQTNIQTEENLKLLKKENQKLNKKVIIKSKISQEMLQNINEIVSFFYQRENDQKENFLQYQNYLLKTLQGIIVHKSMSLSNRPLPKKLQAFDRKTYSNLLSKNQKKIDQLKDFYELFDFENFQQIKKQIQNKIKQNNFKGQVSLPPEELTIDFPEHSEYNIKGNSQMESFDNFNLQDILQEKKTLIAYQKQQPSLFEQIKSLAQFEEQQKLTLKELSQSVEYLRIFNKKFEQLAIIKLKSKEEILSAQYDNYLNESKESTKLIEYKENLINDFQKELEKIQEDVNDKKQENKQLSIDMKKWENQIKEVYQEREEIFMQIENNQEKFDELKSKFQKANNELDQCQEQVRNLKKEIKQNQKSIEEAEQEKKKSQLEINDKMIIQQELKEELRKKEEELNDIIKIKNQNTLKINHQRSVLQRRDSKIALIQKDIENLKLEFEDAIKLTLQKKEMEQKNLFMNQKLLKNIEKLKDQKQKDFNEDKLQEHLQQYKNQLTNIKQLMPRNLDLKCVDKNMESLREQFIDLFLLIKNTKQDSIDIKMTNKKIEQNKFEIKQIKDQLLKQNVQLTITQQELKQQREHRQKLEEDLIRIKQEHEIFELEKKQIAQQSHQLKENVIDIIQNEVNSLKGLYQQKIDYFDFANQQSQQVINDIQNESQLKQILTQDNLNSQFIKQQQRQSLMPQNSNMSLQDIGQKSMSSLFFNDNSLASENIYNLTNFQSMNSNRQSFNNIIPPIQGFDKINKLSKEFQSSRNLRSFQSQDEKQKFQMQLNKNWNKIVKFLQKIIGVVFKASFVLSNILSRVLQNYKGKPIYIKLKQNVMTFLKESISRHKSSIKKLKGYQKLNKISFEALLSCFQKVHEIAEKESQNQDQLNTNLKNSLKIKQ